MSHDDLCNYCNDLQRAQKLLEDQYNCRVLQVDIHAIFRTISRRKFDAEFYDIKYVSVFEGVSL